MHLKVACLICKKVIFDKELTENEAKQKMTELVNAKYIEIKSEDKEVGGFLCKKCYNKIFESI